MHFILQTPFTEARPWRICRNFCRKLPHCQVVRTPDISIAAIHNSSYLSDALAFIKAQGKNSHRSKKPHQLNFMSIAKVSYSPMILVLPKISLYLHNVNSLKRLSDNYELQFKRLPNWKLGPGFLALKSLDRRHLWCLHKCNSLSNSKALWNCKLENTVSFPSFPSLST